MARRAKATAKLLEQVNVSAPARNRSSDGWIGDTAHQASKSDHNPNNSGVVQAQDITHDPRGGFDSYKFAELLRTKQDRRIKYVISNRKIFAGNDGPSAWKWRAYSGSNPHDQHVHVSVEDSSSLYDDDSAWDIGIGVGIPDPGAPIKTLPLLKLGDKGFYVELLQTLLKKKGDEVDGDFGPLTRTSVIQFQRDHNLDDDGKVGDYTWRELLRPWAKEVKLITPDPYETLNKVALAAKELGAQGTIDEIALVFAAVVRDVLPPTQQKPPTPEPEPEPLPPETYGSMIGGFFSADPYDKKVPTSIRTNNPGALNTSKAVAAMPGYVGASETSPGNKTAIFYTPEQGSAAYWDLLRRYRAVGRKTVSQIINRYGGGQNYSAYLKFVVKTTGLPGTYEIKIDGSDDASLLKFAKAMFRYESGRETPLSDEQITYGFGLGRGDTTMSPAA